MKFYFCETCGKRITEKDVEAGQARNKKLKGVFCAQCSVGVMTMELMPVSEDEARKILGKSPTPASGTPFSPGSSSGKPKRETTGVQVITRKAGDSESHIPRPLPSAVPRNKSQSAMVGVVAGLAVAVVLGVVLLFSGGEKPKPAATVKSETPPERAVSPVLPGPVLKPEPVKAAPSKTAASEDPKQDPPPPVVKSDDPAAPVTPAETKTDDLAKTEPPVAPVAKEETQERSLAQLKLDDFQGGGTVKNFWNQGKDGRAIWGRLSTRPSMSATFRVDAAPAGEGIVRVLSLRHERKEACKVAIELNGKSIFDGEDPATNWVWTKHDFKVPPGLLKAGENKLTFFNREETNAENMLPWYMINEVEVLAAGGAAIKTAPPPPPAKVVLQSLVQLKQDEFSGGYAFPNMRSQGKTGRAIWGKQSGKTALTASFKLVAAPAGDAVLRILSLHHERKEPCRIGFELNGKSFYEGPDPATTMGWERCSFKIPAGLLVAGENKLALCNREEGIESHPPWYMINELEVLAPAVGSAAPAVPEITPLATIKVTDLQDGLICENYLSLGKDGQAIYGAKSQKPTMQAAFKLDAAPAGACVLRITSFRHRKPEPCKISMEINKTVIFEGDDPSTTVETWEDHDFKIPAGLLVAGENKLKFSNREDTDMYLNFPYYMVHQIRVLPGTVVQTAAAGSRAVAASFNSLTVCNATSFGETAGNVENTDKDGMKVAGAKSDHATISAAFKLNAAPQGESVLRMVSYRHEKATPCRVTVEVNGTTVYDGKGASTNVEWETQDLKLPAGLLVAGDNKVAITNRSDCRDANFFVQQVEMLAEPVPVKQLAAIKADEFRDGLFVENYQNRGPGCAIYSMKSGQASMQGQFKLDALPQGASVVRISGLRDGRGKSPRILVELNKTTVFEGTAPSENANMWEEHDFPVPDGLLAAGQNTLMIQNREAEGAAKSMPYYMVHEVRIMTGAGASPETLSPERTVAVFAPILAEDQRTILRFYNDTFAKLKNQQPDAALAAARGTKIAEAKPLAALLERADALNKKALDALNKKPPATPITFKFKNEELTGQLKRVDGAFAWVVSKGLEVRVGVDELPTDIFLEALALDATKPEGQYDLVAFLFANGRAEAAVAQAKKMDPVQAGELMDMLEHYRILQHLGLFEDAVLAIEDAIKEAKTQDAQRMLASIKKSFADLATGDQKERVENLEARAEATKLANRIKDLFSGEVLALRDDLYIELKYDFTKAGATREDFKGPQWALVPGALNFSQHYGADAELHFKALFQPKALHAEFVQNAVDHDYCVGYLGKVYASVRWIGGGQVNSGFADKPPDVFNGKPWKHPGESGVYRYVFDRSDKEVAFKLDQTEFLREKLPAQAADEKTCEIKLLPSRSIAVKEVVIKGFLDKDWVQDALKNLPQTPASGASGYRPGLWASFYSGDANDRMKTYHLSRMEPKLFGDFGLGAPDKSIPVDNFAEVLDGYIKIDVEGEYLFELWADDYMSLKIGETLVAEASTGQVKRTKGDKGRIMLTKGYMPLKAKFIDVMNLAKFITKWKPPGAANFEEIPASVFFHDAKQEEKK